MKIKSVEDRTLGCTYNHVFFHVRGNVRKRICNTITAHIQIPVELSSRIRIKEFLGWAMQDEFEL